MKYDRELAFMMLKAMEEYEGSRMPDPFKPKRGRVGTEQPPNILTGSEGRPVSDLLRDPSLWRTEVPTHTSEDSWVGEIERHTFLRHSKWLREEKLIEIDEDGLPTVLTFAGVDLLMDIEAKGGWATACALADASQQPRNLKGVRRALQVIRPSQARQ